MLSSLIDLNSKNNALILKLPYERDSTHLNINDHWEYWLLAFTHSTCTPSRGEPYVILQLHLLPVYEEPVNSRGCAHGSVLTPRVYLTTVYKCRTLYFRTASMTHVNLFPRSVLLRDSTSPPRVRTLGLKVGMWYVCLQWIELEWVELGTWHRVGAEEQEHKAQAGDWLSLWHHILLYNSLLPQYT